MPNPPSQSAGPIDFSPIHLLDWEFQHSKPSCAFACKDITSARRWQKRTARELKACLGFLDQEPVALSPQVVEEVDRGDYVRRKVILRTAAKARMPVYLLVPKRPPGPLPVVLAFHGHGYGVKDMVGLWENGGERFTPDGYHRDFACELARRGFLVAAPEISCFGERRAEYSALPELSRGITPDTCHNAATYAFMLGKSVIGLRVWDALRLVDYLQTLPQADTQRLGAMGISGGGMHTLFSTALDRRIRACVISGYFCDWRHSILAMHHCTCNFAPGLLRLGELSDLAGLIAPRPCLVEAADHDPIFPFAAVKATVARARRAWKVFGAADALATDYFPGRHQISGAKAYDFLQQHLKLPA